MLLGCDFIQAKDEMATANNRADTETKPRVIPIRLQSGWKYSAYDSVLAIMCNCMNILIASAS